MTIRYKGDAIATSILFKVLTIKYDGDSIATGVMVVFGLNATPKNFSVVSGCSVIILHCS